MNKTNKGIKRIDSKDFEADFKGELISPESEQYEEARKIWNGMIDRRPGLIVRPIDNDDVITVVKFAAQNDVLLSIRGGGHNIAGHATNDGGIVIDMSSMKKIEVDAKKHTARAQGGVTWGELDAATQVHGLATPGGVFSKTGIAGLTLGGGYGYLRNKYGLSCDNLIGADVVTASGEVVHTSTTEYSDLLWALRGGGGNFGVVTSFEYKLHPVGPEVMAIFVFHKAGTLEQMKHAIRSYRDFSLSAPDEVGTVLAIGKIPPDEHFPESLHLEPFALYAGVYAGDVEEGKNAFQPLMDVGEPLLDYSGIMPYVEVQQMFDPDYPDGLRYYWKSLNLQKLDETAIERIAHHASRQQSPFCTTDLWHIGGAVTRVSLDESAFYGRQASFLLNPEANWVDAKDDDANISWARNFVDDMETYSDGSRYLNFAGFQEEGEEMMRKSFGDKYARLQELKQRYDPDNLFQLNQNIKPVVSTD